MSDKSFCAPHFCKSGEGGTHFDYHPRIRLPSREDTMLDTVLQDIRYALRTLARSPGFTVAAVATLGLGIGATALVFSMVNATILRPFPYSDPSRLVMLGESDKAKGDDHVGTSYPNFLSWRESANSFSSISAFYPTSVSMRVGREAEHFDGAIVSANLFETLGMKPVVGRTFAANEEGAGSPRAVVLSYELWQKQFRGAPDAVGRTVYVNAEPYTVVGVMPARFGFPERAELWIPFRAGADEDRGSRHMSAIARLKPGVTVEAARTEMNGIAKHLEASYPGPNGGHTADVDGFQAAATRGIRPIILILLGAVGFVLLIACANVANLMLARAATRDREMAIRSAIGAAGWRLARQLLTESLMIALMGGVLGVLFGAWWLDLLVSRLPADVPYWMHFDIDRTVLLFVAGVAVVTSVVFGMVPALQAGRADLQATLKEGGRTSVGQRRARMRSVFVVSQLAAAIVLLVGALLLVRSFLAMQRVDPGFATSNIVTMEVTLPDVRYPDDAKVTAFYDRLVTDLRTIPGVKSAAAVSWFPVGGSSASSNFSIEGIGEVEAANAYNEAVTPDYFRAMGIRLLHGRFFDSRDRAGGERTMIVNKQFADRFFPGKDPIGKGVMFGASDKPDYARIVGVVSDVNERDINQKAPGLDMYAPMMQSPVKSASLVLQTRATSASLMSGVRDRVRAIDPDVSVFEARTVEAIIEEATWDARLTGALFGMFALGALLLAGIGLYGVIAYMVSQRTHEIGVRMALGASRQNVIGMVLRQGAQLTAIGCFAGLALAFGLARVLANTLFGVSTADPYTFAIVPALLAGVALLATWLPARRATRVNPITALRTD
jgi:putative ABC transport system permease protein